MKKSDTILQKYMSSVTMPMTPAVAHYYSHNIDNIYACFVCTIGHEFKFKKKTAESRCQRYGGAWIYSACPSCLTLVCMGVEPARLAELAISNPTAVPRVLYYPASDPEPYP